MTARVYSRGILSVLVVGAVACGGKVVIDAGDGGADDACMAPPPEVCHQTSFFYALLIGYMTPCPGKEADAYEAVWACACDCSGACPEACGDGGICQGVGSPITARPACNSSAAPSTRPAWSTEGICWWVP